MVQWSDRSECTINNQSSSTEAILFDTRTDWYLVYPGVAGVIAHTAAFTGIDLMLALRSGRVCESNMRLSCCVDIDSNLTRLCFNLSVCPCSLDLLSPLADFGEFAHMAAM